MVKRSTPCQDDELRSRQRRDLLQHGSVHIGIPCYCYMMVRNLLTDTARFPHNKQDIARYHSLLVFLANDKQVLYLECSNIQNDINFCSFMQ